MKSDRSKTTARQREIIEERGKNKTQGNRHDARLDLISRIIMRAQKVFCQFDVTQHGTVLSVRLTIL